MPSKEQVEEAEKIVKPNYNPALLAELHKKGEDDVLDIDDMAPVVDEIDEDSQMGIENEERADNN